MPTRTRPRYASTRGAHRESAVQQADGAKPDPPRATGPRPWVVSVGVLGVLAVLGVAGAYIVDDGGGASGTAAVVPGGGAWSASTLSPSATSSDPIGSTGAISSAGPIGSTVEAAGGSPGDASGASAAADDDTAGRVDDGTTAPGTAGTGTGTSVAGVSLTDREAGIATSTLVEAGTGTLLVVPGSVPAPTVAPRMTVRVEVEEGIGADGPAFARFVMDTLNDSRSWGHGNALTFARTDGTADFRVILASPRTSATLCAPAQTRGTLSCGGGGKAVITMYRWMNGTPDYGTDLTGYRHYVVNHEVGHVLGHAHAYCDPGHLAPVMVQQTKGLQGCLPNAWPFPPQ